MTKHHLAALLVAACFVCAGATSVFAAGNGDGAASAEPRPVQEKKIYTNEDIDALASRYGGSITPQPSAAQGTSARVVSSSEGQRSAVGGAENGELEAMTHEKDPRWYVKQSISLDAELGDTDSKLQRLREFRATGSGLPTGLVLSAPCEGITTDNEIEQLDLRRQEIERQMGELDDTARRNGFPPGFIRTVPELVQAFQNSVPMTPEEERAVLTEQLRRAGRELAIVQGVIGGMKREAEARGMTLLPYAPEYGGGPSADFLQRLDARANVLESQISAAEDTARQASIPLPSIP
jgi:hypothetical protein